MVSAIRIPGGSTHHALSAMPRKIVMAETITLGNPGAFGNAKVLRTAFPAAILLRQAGIQGPSVSGSSRRQASIQALRASSESESSAKLVRDSWQVLRKDAGTHATAFFLKVFEIAPTVKQLFSFMRDTDLPPEKNPQLKSHALVVFSMTCEGAVLLGEDPTLAAMRPKLLEMGHTHVVHKVLDEHFDVVKYALLETLKDALKDEWSPALKAAWSEAYDAVAKTIKDEMHRVRGLELAI